MFNRFIKWIDNIVNKDTNEMVAKSIESNIQFLTSLDARQVAYYSNLHDSWRKEMTRLENRIYELEQKVDKL